MLTITDINNNADSIRVYDHRTQYNKNDLLYAAERVKNAKHANINRRGGRISLQHKINCNGVIKHNTPRQLKHKLFIEQAIDEYGDAFIFNILDNEFYNNVIVIKSRDFNEINNSEYGELYDAIKKRADDMAGMLEDIKNNENDIYNSAIDCIIDMLDLSPSLAPGADQADEINDAAAAYWYNKISFNEYAAALLTALTPHKWNCCTLRGCCQGDWINILYPADVYSDNDIKEYECYFFGMYYEYNARYNGDNITYFYSDNYIHDEIINYIAADFNAAPDQIIFNSCY